MTDFDEDLNSWPNDPFELLNLDRSDDIRTARRAYFKLIRKYKPDRFPAEFQKIHEAYGEVQEWLQWQDHQHEDDDDVDEDETAGDTFDEASVDFWQIAEPADDSNLLADQTGLSDNLPSQSLKADSVDRFFETLKSDGLYAALPQLNNVAPFSDSNQIAKASLLKYFYGRFFPKSTDRSLTAPASEDANWGHTKSDPKRGDLKRIAWLLQALDSPDTANAAMAQLRFEFDRNYRLANCKSVIDYLAKVKDFRDLASFYKLRWEAIGHHQPLTVVQDIKSLQPRSLEFGGYRGNWLSLVTESMNYTVWHQDEKCKVHTKTCWQEISTTDQTWTADSVELLILASQELIEMKAAASNWMAAIPWARNTLPTTTRAIWMPVAKELSGDPVGSLSGLDHRFRNHSMAMTVFEEGLQNLAQREIDLESDDEMQWRETRELVSCFLIDLGTNDYAECRISVMEFCIMNHVSLTTFASAANTFLADEDNENWSNLVQRDAPLRCVVNACHATNW